MVCGCGEVLVHGQEAASTGWEMHIHLLEVVFFFVTIIVWTLPKHPLLLLVLLAAQHTSQSFASACGLAWELALGISDNIFLYS